MAGWKTQDMLAGIDGIMQLAAASGEDLATVSDIVTDGPVSYTHLDVYKRQGSMSYTKNMEYGLSNVVMIRSFPKNF